MTFHGAQNVRPKAQGGKRDDGGKLRWDLIPVPALVAFCKVWHAGGLKYGDENWRKGLVYSRIYRPMISHFNKWLCTDSSYDKQLGTHHLLMVAWGCFVLYMYEAVLGLPDLDNRPDTGTMTDEDFEYEDPLGGVGEMIKKDMAEGLKEAGQHHFDEGSRKAFVDWEDTH